MKEKIRKVNNMEQTTNDHITDFNNYELVRFVDTPYPVYNSYLYSSTPVLNKPETTEIEKMSFAACAGSVYVSHCEFRLLATLQSYCDFIQLITKDAISNIALYEALHFTIENAVQILESGRLFAEGAINEHNAYNFAFSIASGIFTDTVDFLYSYGVKISDDLYNDLTAANIIFAETFTRDLNVLLEDYQYCYKPFLTAGDKIYDR